MKKIRIYLDSCCLNRPFDDQSSDKVRMESEAVLTIINRCEQSKWEYCKSDVLYDEINRTDDVFKMEKVLSLYDSATVYIELNEQIIARAKELIKASIKPFDSLHIASAEFGKADVFLTTDKKLINATKRTTLSVRVTNPVAWLIEVLYDE